MNYKEVQRKLKRGMHNKRKTNQKRDPKECQKESNGNTKEMHGCCPEEEAGANRSQTSGALG